MCLGMSKASQALKSHTKKHILVAMILSILFTIAWVFGLIGMSDEPQRLHEPAQYIFAVFIALHAVVTLILHTFRSPDARESWTRLWYIVTCSRDKYSPKRTFDTAEAEARLGRYKDTELSSRSYEGGGEQSPTRDDMPLNPQLVEPKVDGTHVVENTYVTTGGSGGKMMVDEEEKNAVGGGGDSDEDADGMATKL